MCGAPYMVMFLAPRRDGCGVVRFLAGIPGVVTDGRTQKKKTVPTTHGTLKLLSVLFLFLVVCCSINGFIYSPCCSVYAINERHLFLDIYPGKDRIMGITYFCLLL